MGRHLKNLKLKNMKRSNLMLEQQLLKEAPGMPLWKICGPNEQGGFTDPGSMGGLPPGLLVALFVSGSTSWFSTAPLTPAGTLNTNPFSPTSGGWNTDGINHQTAADVMAGLDTVEAGGCTGISIEMGPNEFGFADWMGLDQFQTFCAEFMGYGDMVSSGAFPLVYPPDTLITNSWVAPNIPTPGPSHGTTGGIGSCQCCEYDGSGGGGGIDPKDPKEFGKDLGILVKDKEVTDLDSFLGSPMKEPEIKIDYRKKQIPNELFMEKRVVSLSEQMIKSRNHYKSLLNEQGVIITGVRACKCEEWDGVSCESGLTGMSLKPYINNGGIPVVGDTFQGAGSTNSQEWVVAEMNNNNSGAGTHVNQIASCGMAESGCDLATFTNLMGPGLGSVPNQFMQQLTQNWLPMFHDKYFNHPDGCRFLNKRLDINQAKLDQLINAGTNPQWQAMLTGKIMAIQAVINNCCN